MGEHKNAVCLMDVNEFAFLSLDFLLRNVNTTRTDGTTLDRRLSSGPIDYVFVQKSAAEDVGTVPKIRERFQGPLIVYGKADDQYAKIVGNAGCTFVNTFLHDIDADLLLTLADASSIYRDK